MNAHDANTRLARTMNLGLALDAPVEGEWGLVVAREHLTACRDAGFTAIRLPVQWATRTAGTAPFPVEPAALDRVVEIVGWARELGLAVVLGDHPDETLMADPAGHHDRFLALWAQLTTAFADVPADAVFFEPLCEPHGALEPVWNDLVAEVLAVIRGAGDARPVVVGPTGHNRADHLAGLDLPADDRGLVVTFHWYLPVAFTMQGEPWFAEAVPGLDTSGWPGTPWTPADPELTIAHRVFDAVQAWGREHDRPVFLGEFGVSDTADPVPRAAWLRAHRVAAEERGFSWGHWSFASLFSAYDLRRGRFRDEVLTALIPGGPR